MTFIQCENKSECEDELQRLGSGFMTDDHRIYSKLTFGDDGLFYTFDAATILHLYNLQLHLEMVSDDGYENGFLVVEKAAKEVSEQFKKALEAIKFKPMERRKR